MRTTVYLCLLCVTAVAAALAGNESAFAGQSRTVQLPTSGGQVCVSQAVPTDHSRYPVTGRVVDDLTGAPIAGAKVRLEVAMAGCGAGPVDPLLKYDGPNEVETDEAGGFRFANVPAAMVNITVSRQHYVQPSEFRRPARPSYGYSIGPNLGSVTLRLAPRASISGVLRGEDGTPLRGAWVALYVRWGWAGWLRMEYAESKQTGSDGSYSFPDLQPGRYFLVADPPHAIPEEDPPVPDAQGLVRGYAAVRYPPVQADDAHPFLKLKEGDNLHTDFLFEKKILHFVSGANPVKGNFSASLDLRDENGSNAYVMKARANEDHFEAWLPTGKYQVSARYVLPGEEYVSDAWMPLEVRDSDLLGLAIPITLGRNVEIPVEVSTLARPGVEAHACHETDRMACGFWFLTIEGPVVGPESNRPSAVTDTNHKPNGASWPSVSVRPGSYGVSVISTGITYAKSVMRGSTDLSRELLVVKEGEGAEPIRVVLAEGGSVVGSVVGAAKATGAYIYALPEEPNNLQFNPQVSDEDGKFQMNGLPPGKYFFFATDEMAVINIHDPKEVALWKSFGQAATVYIGKKTEIRLTMLQIENIE
jgi:hypothetical protein